MQFNGKLSQTEIIDKWDNNTIYANVPLVIIDFNDWPRHDTKILDEGIHSLSGSIMEVGFINPIILRPKTDTIGRYEVVDGNRGVRVARIAKMRFIPSIIKKDLSGNDFEVMIQKLVLHLHTEPLTDEKAEEATRLLNAIKNEKEKE